MSAVVARAAVVGQFGAVFCRDVVVSLERVAFPCDAHPCRAVPVLAFPSFLVVRRVPFPACPSLGAFHAVPFNDVVHANLVVLFDEQQLVVAPLCVWHLYAQGVYALFCRVGVGVVAAAAGSVVVAA